MFPHLTVGSLLLLCQMPTFIYQRISKILCGGMVFMSFYVIKQYFCLFWIATVHKHTKNHITSTIANRSYQFDRQHLMSSEILYYSSFVEFCGGRSVVGLILLTRKDRVRETLQYICTFMCLSGVSLWREDSSTLWCGQRTRHTFKLWRMLVNPYKSLAIHKKGMRLFTRKLQKQWEYAFLTNFSSMFLIFATPHELPQMLTIIYESLTITNCIHKPICHNIRHCVRAALESLAGPRCDPST